MNAPVIAVDGPGGAGKGTLCFSLADRLGWHMLDSGALYRVTAYAAAQRGRADADETELASIAADLDVTFVPAPGGLTRVLLAGEEITEAIRTEQCGARAWSPTGATWARWSSLPQPSRSFSRRAPRSARGDARRSC